MAAKRIGSFLSNLTGTSGQILRVKTDESGFEFFSPSSLPIYTITNDSTDRVLNALDTNLDELANVVSTLIKDLTDIHGTAGISAFQWSTSEQVWPFEKASDGSTLYAIQMSFSVSANSQNAYAHSIADTLKIHSSSALLYRSDNGEVLPLSFAYTDSNYNIDLQIDPGYLYINVGSYGGNLGSRTVTIRLIYGK